MKKVAAVVAPGAQAATGYAIQFKKSGKTLQWCGDHTSILDLAEANGISIPSGCRAGSCGTCQVAVFSGEVDYIEKSDFETDPAPASPASARPRATSSSTLDFLAAGGYFALPLKPSFPAHCLLVRLPLLATALLFCASCSPSDDAKITVYRIPKETQPDTPAQSAAMNGGAAPAVHWTAPTGWEKQPASGFRKGSFLVRGAEGKTADVSVISFPEAAGGLLANVNRWRNQLKLAPIPDEAQAGTPMTVSGRDMFFVDLVSEQPIRPMVRSRAFSAESFRSMGRPGFSK